MSQSVGKIKDYFHIEDSDDESPFKKIKNNAGFEKIVLNQARPYSHESKISWDDSSEEGLKKSAEFEGRAAEKSRQKAQRKNVQVEYGDFEVKEEVTEKSKKGSLPKASGLTIVNQNADNANDGEDCDKKKNSLLQNFWKLFEKPLPCLKSAGNLKKEPDSLDTKIKVEETSSDIAENSEFYNGLFDANGLEGAFQILKYQNKPEYDANFTRIYGFEDKNLDNKRLFNAFRPFLFDLLKRREDLKGFLKILKQINSRERMYCKGIIKSLEVKDLTILLLESCSRKSMAKLGQWLTNQFYPLPIFYPVGIHSYKLNLDCCIDIMFQTGKILITSVGTKNTVQKGKSSLLSYLFSISQPVNFSTSKGFTHNGSVDLYAKLPQKSFANDDPVQYIIADVNGHVDDSDFTSLTSKLCTFSQLLLIHITIDDVYTNSETKEINDMERFIVDMFSVDTLKIKFVLLLRDYDEEEDPDILNRLQRSLELNDNYLGTIPIPRLDDPQNVQDEIDSIKDEILAGIKEILLHLRSPEDSAITNILNSYISAYLNYSIKPDEVAWLIRRMLDSKNNENKQLCSALFPCFWIDFLLNQQVQKKKKIDINHSDLTEIQIFELTKRYHETANLIKAYEETRAKIEPSDLIQYICTILSSNNIAKTSLLSEIINQWKMPLVDPLKKEYLKLAGEKKIAQEDKRRELEQTMKDLEEEIEDKDISLDAFLDEIHSLHEAGKLSKFHIDGTQSYISSNMKEGAPINIVNGKTLRFGSRLLKEIFAELTDQNKKVYVISIIGAQSSAKSTLLNVLFGCGFATSAGRCTKGLYISLMQHPDGSYLIIVDTEGLLSVVARDHEFDNLIATMAFSCSHLVITKERLTPS